MVIEIADDFDLGRIAQSGQCFRFRGMNDGSYRVIQGQSCVYIAPLGNNRYCFECDEAEFRETWHDYFDLDESYEGIRSRIDPAEDPFLWEAAEQQKGIRILRQDAWEMLVSFIISQNRNIPAIQNSVELLSQAAGVQRVDARGCAYRGFPTPGAVASMGERELMACKLGYRWKYVRAAATTVLEGSVDLLALREAGEAETMRQLTSIHGVGVKVANCVSLFGLHHIDAFPVDIWIKRALEAEYPDGFPFDRYRPYNGVFQQYLFAYYREAHPR